MPIVEFELAVPLGVDELWLARGGVPLARPLMQGDVFERTPSNQNGTVMVITHPCSMRAGPRLRPRQTVVNVGSIKAPLESASWRDGYYDYMPLPGLEHCLMGKGYPVADFRLISSESTEDLVTEKRIAALAFEGILLLQQRLAHHLTRAVVDLPTLAWVSEAVFIEAELQEEWVESATMGLPPAVLNEAVKSAEIGFQELLDQQGGRLRRMLAELQTRPGAIREVRRSIADGAPNR